ncbi:flagellar protein export ATPase FliI [Photobacterium damselae subsp. damselae]|uniref:flagellar protein export ATPase FliI n=1 Tax=Photobacterium damselae TaxID=38293 RepID=UPI0010FCF95B|nr:flagellar protein export ATPase FliI [Photobacterium damselae]MBA5682551.1 flagellar protein export ATPase FliI [Photobacterium damselae subsp. damselae]NVH50451.1 flagellar protein export ATPase FliI [Photobacterium damselae subsp. damselae]NVO83228.1 flagellar protein export ATPase FliI [Photobacterium damselae subsp. damselae]TLS82954.1 flagellar protein export ATPase FliI [Photobacterium damselae subsp. damselae]TLS90460.1 flagellar protein export ATPase FliI [Photobacterium damselae su
MTLAQELAKFTIQGLACRPVASGRLTRVVGLTLEAVGCRAPVGSLCKVETVNGELEAEVIGFSGDTLFLMPSEQLTGVMPSAKVTPILQESGLPVGPELLGRVIDGVGNPLDGLGDIYTQHRASFSAPAINPLKRKPIKEPLDVGLKAINGCLTVGKGQRIGLFAGSGVGKSVTLGMMTRGTTAQVVVVGLIGERGREVKEFIDEILGEEGRQRSVVVAAPADASPLMRLKGCQTALTIAEYFRDQGQDVLLLMDSLTRFAQAQREIALSVGEPPATKGYPPSVFAKLPALVERAGNGDENQGSITAFFTVLSEGDDLQDPIADASRAILDGHIVLSREMADAGHYPAIDVERSVSRVMPAIVTEEHMIMAKAVRQILSICRKNQDLVAIGAYKPGTDPNIDQAFSLKPRLDGFLQQGMKESVPYEMCVNMLRSTLS